MTSEEMQQKKRELGYTYQKISDMCGVPLPTVQKIIMGETENPREYNKCRIESVLNQIRVSEGMPALPYMLKQQGEYTIDDYYRLSDDERCELIDGVIYDMCAPRFIHQDVQAEILFQLKSYIKKNNGPCKVLASPIDVKLDDKTMVQPDVLILCDQEKNIDIRIDGAPDLVVEITSPATRRRDFTIKLNKYMASGVKEFWIVDLKQNRIYVYELEDEDFLTKIYKINDNIPVGIWEGQCEVNIGELFK